MTQTLEHPTAIDRLSIYKVAPGLYDAMMKLSTASATDVDPTIGELIKIRASQINHCAFCLDMHVTDARKQGETEQRLYVLSAWREAPFFSDRERAALAWTEALTLVATKGAPDEATHEALAAQFSAEEQVKLTMLINAINGWNRIAVGFRLFYPAAQAAVAAA